MSYLAFHAARHDDIALKLWYRHQTDRLIVDYLVRTGNYDLAVEFSTESNLLDFDDVDLFAGKVKPVVECLMKGDIKEAQRWMVSNASKLKKMDSSVVRRFELELHVQEFVALLLASRSGEAIKFAQETFLAYTQMGEQFEKRVTHAMSLVVFLGVKDSPLALEFTGPLRWKYLIQEFHKVFFAVYGLTEEPLLSVAVLCGLHALNTPACVRHGDGSSTSKPPEDCPACAAVLMDLVPKVPLPSRLTSSLVCPITRLPIDETNYPVALPNGSVYSKAAINQATDVGTSKFTDPRTGEQLELSSVRRVFIM